MIGKNQFVIRGNIIRKPMLRYTKDKYPVAFIAIAENYSVRTKDGWENNVRFHDLVAFGNWAERAVKHLDKGYGVECEGRIIPQTIEDTISGKKYKTSSIVVYRYAILSRPRPQTQEQLEEKQKEEYSDEENIEEENQNFNEDNYTYDSYDNFDDFAQHYLSLPEQMLEIAARNPAHYQ